MRTFFLTCLILGQSFFAQASNFYESSEHFQISCTESDRLISNQLLESAEPLFSKLSIDFDIILNQKIQINIFPNPTAFHQAIGWKDAPNWVVATSDHETIDIVSPLNPGPYHSGNSIRKILMLNIVKLFIYQKFGVGKAPYWFIYGVASNKVDYHSSSKMPKTLPELEQLENPDSKKFGEIGGFQCAYFFTSFIESNYGWEKILQLLAHYDQFEQIMGISKENLYSEWVHSLPKEI